MLTTALLVIVLLMWSFRLLEKGWTGREGSLLLAGTLVMLAAAAVLFVHAQLSRIFTL
jgi:hypothetical protein